MSLNLVVLVKTLDSTPVDCGLFCESTVALAEFATCGWLQDALRRALRAGGAGAACGGGRPRGGGRAPLRPGRGGGRRVQRRGGGRARWPRAAGCREGRAGRDGQGTHQQVRHQQPGSFC